ncbi:PREDICTED: uncharacterized protein LOC18601381 isoform X1 [Theobroma cacao]|uniref:Uncharacterized protein LOC18601381 isoform X1 n=1 Tax=Theobroma cacao TaxID=3641 RepID=A0AB32X3P7_THECC|nr:PREDICTED: uncharacterized protein LOC18601381 isoform X1 [Theobroma cacao]
MAGIDPSKNLLSLIRDFAYEKSQGVNESFIVERTCTERRVASLTKQVEELRSQFEVANSEFNEAKRLKETTEQELKGFEVELALNEALIQAVEARIALIQDEIFKVGSEIEALKNKEATLRDEFITEMVEFNDKIRKFQETIASDFQYTVGSTAEQGHIFVKKEVTAIGARTVEDQFAHIVSQITKEQEEYLAEQNIQKQVQLELVDIERKACLIEALMQQAKALEELTRLLNWKRYVLSLVRSYRRDVYVPVAFWKMWRPWLKFFRKVRQTDLL